MSRNGKEKKRNVWRTALAVFVAALILCATLLLIFSSGDSFGKYSSSQDVHGTFSHDVKWTLLDQNVVDDLTTTYETDEDGNYKLDNDGNKIPIESDDEPTKKLTLTDEAYHLEGDIEADITVPEDTEVTLCLNGHVLKGLGDTSVITVAGGGTLHLCDCYSYKGIHYYKVDGTTGLGELTSSTTKDEVENLEGDYIDGGVVTGGNALDGGGIFVQAGGTLTMNSGYVFGNYAKYDGNASETSDDGSTVNFTGRGGGVCVLGSFTMTGGSIQHNSSDRDGAGVYVYNGGANKGDGTFNMGGDAKVRFNKDVDAGEDCGGGGVFLETGTFTMTDNAWLYDNTTKGYGGGLLIEGMNGDAVFTMSGEASVTDNLSDGPGGGIYMYGDYARGVMNGGRISKNTAGSSGGGVFIYRGSFTMNEGSIGGTEVGDDGNTVSNGNTATTKISGDGGGGVFVDQPKASFTMYSGYISYNKSNMDAGGVKVDHGSFTMEGGEISNNSAGNGGGVHIGYNDGSFTMNGGKLSENAANGLGGAVCINVGTFTISGGEIGNNTSTGGGAGVYVNDSSAKIVMSGGRIVGNDNGHDSSGNYTQNSGGAVYINSGKFEMSGGEITDNVTRWGGAGVYIYGGGSFEMTDGDIHDNSNLEGSGAGVFVYVGSFIMSGGYIRNNYAPSSGGGIYIDQGSASITLSGGEISGNKADKDGGGVYVDLGTFEMTGGEISLNTTSYNGGGVYFNSGTKFSVTGGTIGGYDVVDDAAVGHGNTAANGGGVYINSTSFSFSETIYAWEICYNTATSGTGVSGGIYFNKSIESFAYSHGNVYNNSPYDVVASSGIVTSAHAYPNPDAKNIDELVVWDWENKTDSTKDEISGNVTNGQVSVSVYCTCGYAYESGTVEYTVDQYDNLSSTDIDESSSYVWYLSGTYYVYDSNNSEKVLYTYEGLYREDDALDEEGLLLYFGSQDKIPEASSEYPYIKADSDLYLGDLFKLTADVSMNYSGGRSNNVESYVIYPNLSYTDMRGDVQNPDAGIVSPQLEAYGDEKEGYILKDIYTITAFDDIYLYLYLQISNVSYNSNRSGYIICTVDGVTSYYDRTGSGSGVNRWSITPIVIELKAGQTLTIGAINCSSSTARLWFFGVECYAVKGNGISESVKAEEGVTSITLSYDENLADEKGIIYITAGETITITAQAWNDYEARAEYTGSKYTWETTSYDYVAYNISGGVLTLYGMAPSEDITSITVTVGSVSVSFDIVVKSSGDEDDWADVAYVDFTDGFSEGTILDAGYNGVKIAINDTGFSAVGNENDSTAIEIGKSTTVDESGDVIEEKTYLKFNGSASTTKGVISYYLEAGTYKIEITYFNANTGRWPVVMDVNGERLGGDVYDSQKTTSDGEIHTRIITFTIDERMDIYIGSENSGLYILTIAIYKLPGYEADVTFIPESLKDGVFEIVLGEESTSIDSSFSFYVDFVAEKGAKATGYTVSVESLSPSVEVYEPSLSDDSYTVNFTATRGVATVRISVYANDDKDTLAGTFDLTIVVKSSDTDTVEVSFMVPSVDVSGALDDIFAKNRPIDDNYLFTITNGSAHEMGYTTGEISGNIAYVDMYGNKVTPDQAIYTERNIEDSDDILRFTAKDNIYLYVYVALADTKFASSRTGNVIYYYICDAEGKYTTDSDGNILYNGSYTVSSLADMCTICVYLEKGQTLVIGYIAASGTNSTLYFFGAEATTCTTTYVVSIDVSVNETKIDNGTGRLTLTIFDDGYSGKIEGADTGKIAYETTVKDNENEISTYAVCVESMNDDIAYLELDEVSGKWTGNVIGKSEGVTYVVIYVVSPEGFVIDMEKVEVVVELVTIEISVDGVVMDSGEGLLELTVGSKGTFDVNVTVSVNGVAASDYSVNVTMSDIEGTNVASLVYDEDTGEWTGGVIGVSVGTCYVVISVSSENDEVVATETVTVVVTADSGDGDEDTNP